MIEFNRPVAKFRSLCLIEAAVLRVGLVAEDFRRRGG